MMLSPRRLQIFRDYPSATRCQCIACPRGGHPRRSQTASGGRVYCRATDQAPQPAKNTSVSQLPAKSHRRTKVPVDRGRTHRPLEYADGIGHREHGADRCLGDQA